MNIKDKEILVAYVDQISQAAQVLNTLGCDVETIMQEVRKFNRGFVIPEELPVFKPISRPLMEFSEELIRERESVFGGGVL